MHVLRMAGAAGLLVLLAAIGGAVPNARPAAADPGDGPQPWLLQRMQVKAQAPAPQPPAPPPAPPVEPKAADEALPPRLSLPPNEFLPGTLAEVKAEVKRDIGYGAKMVKAPEAWAKNSKAKGAGIKVAILDTGAQVDHPWIAPNIKGTYNAIRKTRDVKDGHGHGTHCAGTVVEACPEVELYIVKVLDDSGSGSVVDIAHGVDYAVTEFKVDVVSLSLGGPSADSYIPPSFARATTAGTIISCAAGNEGPGNNTDGWPARYVQAISVAANDENGAVANFSSRGASVYTITPGVRIVSSLPGNKSGQMSGTSMACPLHAALAAVWCATASEAKPERPAAYRVALKMASKHPPTRNTSDGFGLPDATLLVGTGGPVTPPPPPGVPGTVTINYADLNPDAQARLKASGITSLSLSLGYLQVGNPPVPPTPMPLPGSPAACNCPGCTCPASANPAAPKAAPACEPAGSTLWQWPDGTIRNTPPFVIGRTGIGSRLAPTPATIQPTTTTRTINETCTGPNCPQPAAATGWYPGKLLFGR